MIRLIDAIPYTLAALVAVTLIDTLGAIASRVFKFSYVHLSFISFGVYILIGCFISPKCGLSVAILAGLIVGFYDATIGWKLAIRYKANSGISDDELKKITPSMTLSITLFVAPLFVLIGHWLS